MDDFSSQALGRRAKQYALDSGADDPKAHALAPSTT